jgi:hypothetical protein
MKKKEINDPFIYIEKKMPSINNDNEVPMSCHMPQLHSEKLWRRRKMNIKKRKKYQKKLAFVLRNRQQAKEKRYNNLVAKVKEIESKRLAVFDPNYFID